MSQEKKNASLGHVVVVGGCGFLGGHIVRLLLSQYPGSQIACLDVSTARNRVDSPQVTYHNCNITNLLDIEELFLKLQPDVIIHTAAIVPDLGFSKEMVYKVNVEGTKNLLTAAKNTNVKAFVYTSSSSVIVGDVDEVINADESWPVLTGRDQPEYYTETKV
jgi:sterol-4alpha-carboxylate 3-dehydrogenase (decarboxylating)